MPLEFLYQYGCDGLPRKTKKDSKKTRSRLLEAALDIFSEKSFSDVTLDEIAGRVCLTKGALYWHFKNKSDILSKLIEEVFLDSERAFADEYGEPETLADLSSYYKKKLVNPDKKNKFMKVYALMLRRYEWPEDVRSDVFSNLRSLMQKEKTMINDLLLKSLREKIIREDIVAEDVSTAITSVFSGLFILTLNDVVTDDLSKCIDFICNAFIKELIHKKD